MTPQKFFSRHYKALFRIAMRMTHNVEDAEDLLHDAYVAVSKKDEINFGYVSQTIRNLFLNKVNRSNISPVDILEPILFDNAEAQRAIEIHHMEAD